MIPIRFQGCTKGIFGLKSWDEPRPLHAETLSRLDNFLEQNGFPTTGFVGPCLSRGVAVGLNPMSAVYIPSPGAIAALHSGAGHLLGSAISHQSVDHSMPNFNGQPLAKDENNFTSAVNQQQYASVHVQMPRSEVGWGMMPGAMHNVVNGGVVPRVDSGGRIPSTSSKLVSGPPRVPSSELANNATGFCSQSVRVVNPGNVGQVQKSLPYENSGHCLPNLNSSSSNSVPMSNPVVTNVGRISSGVTDPYARWPNPACEEFVPTVDPVLASQVNIRMIAKHNYEGNPNSPLGPGMELSLRQMDKLVKIGCHPEQNLWWLARNERGQEGYVPSTYVMVIEDTAGLPWLKNKPSEEQEMPVAKPLQPYRSAYDKSGYVSKDPTKFGCEVCGKTFNGPQPYQAHMFSRAHREAVEQSQGSV